MTDWTPEEERVARRICAAEGFNPDSTETTDAQYWTTWLPHARAAISAMQPRWRDVRTDPPPPNVSLLLFEPETPGRAGAIVVGMARWGWDNEVASNWSENPWATHWTPLPPAPEPKP